MIFLPPSGLDIRPRRMADTLATRKTRNAYRPATVCRSKEIDFGPDPTGDRFSGCAAKFGPTLRGLSSGESQRKQAYVKGCFSRTLLEQDPAIYINHVDSEIVCGPVNLFLEERPDGLYFVGWPERTRAGFRATLAALAGKIRGVSVGGIIRESHLDSRGVQRVTRLELREVSILIGYEPREVATFVDFETAEKLEAQRQKKISAAMADGW